MNFHRSAHVSSFLLTALVALSGCVLTGQLDDTATETSGGESDGSATTAMGSSFGSSDSSGVMETSGSSGVGGFVCADYLPPALECEPVGTQTAFTGYSTGGLVVFDDTECTVDGIRDRGEAGLVLGFTCGTGGASLFVRPPSPEFSFPFVAGDSILLTIRNQAISSMVRTLDGELLLAHVDVEGFEPDVDLGGIEVVPELSGCPAEPVPIASCMAGGSVVAQRTSLRLSSGGAVSPSVSQGHSAMVDLDGRSFLFVVGHALKTACWDDGCSIDQPYVDSDGAMGFLLVAQSR